ncbi:unnamed protein product [Cyprideis torosa]|uniref:Uncharacterized protein n=1 Tax=Cyprideis torosa TaxID=163714 RepID=A0A7R8ZUC5_9CRUS|nr:unnamed protein product [Cyprideis torosa]CAG0900114.1 unnamed protein product [Cyprideis torosa]
MTCDLYSFMCLRACGVSYLTGLSLQLARAGYMLPQQYAGAGIYQSLIYPPAVYNPSLVPLSAHTPLHTAPAAATAYTAAAPEYAHAHGFTTSYAPAPETPTPASAYMTELGHYNSNMAAANAAIAAAGYLSYYPAAPAQLAHAQSSHLVQQGVLPASTTAMQISANGIPISANPQFQPSWGQAHWPLQRTGCLPAEGPWKGVEWRFHGAPAAED